MLRTIAIGTAILVQGIFVKALPDGRIVVKAGRKTYTGTPANKAA